VLFKNGNAMPDTGKRNGCCQAGSASPDYSDAERIAIWHHPFILDDARAMARKMPVEKASWTRIDPTVTCRESGKLGTVPLQRE
jgi:hypothetical protein